MAASNPHTWRRLNRVAAVLGVIALLEVAVLAALDLVTGWTWTAGIGGVACLALVQLNRHREQGAHR